MAENGGCASYRGRARVEQGQLQVLGFLIGITCVGIRVRPSRIIGSQPSGLDLTLVFERRLTRPQHLAHRVPGHLQVPCDFLDRLALEEMLAPDPPNRLHCQHSPTTRFASKQAAHQTNL
jgi:hypothetical protein